MYKVVIVDDDRIIRKGLSSVIPWAEHGFELVGVAADGEEGLELIKANQPQIVISDIQMPFMNGLEMTKAIKDLDMNTKIILLTGYEDFKYAHEAIKLKAFDYLLKPVETSELIEKLIQASTELAIEYEKEAQISDSQAYLQQVFLKKLSHSSFTTTDLMKELHVLGIQPYGTCTTVLYVKMDQVEFGSHFTLEGMKANLIEECKSVIAKMEIEGYILHAEAEHFAIFLFDTEMTMENARARVDEITQEVRLNVEACFSTTVTISTGRRYPHIDGIGCSYLEAKKAMEFRHMMGTNRAFSIEEIEETNTEEMAIENRLVEELIRYISLGLPEKVALLLEGVKKDIISTKMVSLEEIILLAIRCIHLMLHEASIMAKTWDYTRFTQSESKLMKMQTIDEIFLEITNISMDLASFVKELNRNQKHSLVDKAIRFIKENYHESSVNLQMVAEQVHVSSAYLSNLFKVEKGFNFGDFLLETRMKKAMELFRTTDFKSYEVAEKVGYSNPQYFSSSFKKYTGYSPAEFKRLK